MHATARLKAFGMLIQDFTPDFLIIYFGDDSTTKKMMCPASNIDFWTNIVITTALIPTKKRRLKLSMDHL